MESQPWKAGVLRQCHIPPFPDGPQVLLECSLDSSILIRKAFKIWFTSPVLSTLSLPIPHVTYRAHTGFLSSSATSCLINVRNNLQFVVVVHSIICHLPFWSPSWPMANPPSHVKLLLFLGLGQSVNSSKKPSLTARVWFWFLFLLLSFLHFLIQTTYLAHSVFSWPLLLSIKTENHGGSLGYSCILVICLSAWQTPNPLQVFTEQVNEVLVFNSTLMPFCTQVWKQ